MQHIHVVNVSVMVQRYRTLKSAEIKTASNRRRFKRGLFQQVVDRAANVVRHLRQIVR